MVGPIYRCGFLADLMVWQYVFYFSGNPVDKLTNDQENEKPTGEITSGKL